MRLYTRGSKPEILSRIAQTTAALSRLKIIWRDKNISLASKVIIMIIIIIISLFQEDKIFGTNASLTYGPRLQR